MERSLEELEAALEKAMEASRQVHIAAGKIVVVNGFDMFYCEFHDCFENSDTYYSHCSHCGGRNH